METEVREGCNLAFLLKLNLDVGVARPVGLGLLLGADRAVGLNDSELLLLRATHGKCS